MATAYAHITAPGNTGSGVSDYLHFAPVSWFAVNGIQCPVPPYATLGDEVKVTADHTFLVTKGFLKAICAPSKNMISAATIGEQGSKKFMQKIECFLAGTKEELHATIAGLLNEPLVLLVKDSDCDAGNYYQVGCDCNFAYVESAEFATGTLKDGQKGYKLTFEFPTEKILIYSGVVELKP
ncbi:MAG: hypothetical protein IPJ31_13795 [Bacteroidetes bacterium]|nr:hypothetical protein [Bacteroidota bacterium]